MPRSSVPRRKSRFLAFAIVGVLALAWLQVSGLRTVQELRANWQEEKRLEREIEQLELVNDELIGEIDELAENGELVEVIARQKLGLARKGEHVVRVPEKE